MTVCPSGSCDLVEVGRSLRVMEAFEEARLEHFCDWLPFCHVRRLQVAQRHAEVVLGGEVQDLHEGFCILLDQSCDEVMPL
mmetsp:Transcript_11487/g.26604  ORF Transcript_11487/g.26604 Transcript_11487/m.26604 type:complete len:81 (-) Transcript_11487:1598-1840(-)